MPRANRSRGRARRDRPPGARRPVRGARVEPRERFHPDQWRRIEAGDDELLKAARTSPSGHSARSPSAGADAVEVDDGLSARSHRAPIATIFATNTSPRPGSRELRSGHEGRRLVDEIPRRAGARQHLRARPPFLPRAALLDLGDPHRPPALAGSLRIDASLRGGEPAVAPARRSRARRGAVPHELPRES